MRPIQFTTGNSILAVWGPFRRGTKVRGIRFATAPDVSTDLGFQINLFATREKPTLASYATDGKSLIVTRDGEGDPLATVARVPVGDFFLPLNFIARTCVYIGLTFTDIAGAAGDVDGIVALDTDEPEEI